jgi:predicted nucleic acid-binding Zn ribbon protein
MFVGDGVLKLNEALEKVAKRKIKMMLIGLLILILLVAYNVSPAWPDHY